MRSLARGPLSYRSGQVTAYRHNEVIAKHKQRGLQRTEAPCALPQPPKAAIANVQARSERAQQPTCLHVPTGVDAASSEPAERVLVLRWTSQLRPSCRCPCEVEAFRNGFSSRIEAKQNDCATERGGDDVSKTQAYYS